MIKNSFLKVVCVGLLVTGLFPTMQASAQETRSRGGGLYGDWHVKVDINGMQMPSILSFARGGDGQVQGELIHLWGLGELSDIKYEGGELSFVQHYQYQDQDRSAKFTGSVRRDQLSGTYASDRGDFKAEGERLRRVPAAAGEWETELGMEDRSRKAKLVIKANEQRKLRVEGEDPWGNHQARDVLFKGGTLTFDRRGGDPDRQQDSRFEGKIKGHRLTGSIKSERDEIAVAGKRIGAEAVGLWELDIPTDSGTRKQLLRVYPDLSAWYGPISLGKINAQEGQLTFSTSLTFGERQYDIRFAGRVERRELSGELTTSRGTQSISGQKRRPLGVRQKAPRIKKTPRQPDVVYVPTPQQVVDKMLEMAQVTKDDLLYDLGCGDGRIVVTAAAKYGCQAVGYDIARKRIKESLANVEKNKVGHLVRIEQKDIFTLDLSKASVVTLYLLPELNVKLIPQLEKLKPGSRIVSHDFDMKGVTPDQVVEVQAEGEDWSTHMVYLWTTPLKKVESSED